MNILVVKLSSMGDIVLATPAIRALRGRWPEARIVVAVDRAYVPLLSADPAIDGLIVREPTRKVRRRSTLRQALRARLAAGRPRFDLAVDLHGNPHSVIWTSLSGARTKAGFGDGWLPGWRFRMPLARLRHAVDENADVVERLGVPVADRRPRLHLDPADQRFAGDWLARHGLPDGGFVVVHPFTAWRSKEWPLERHAAVLRRVMAGRNGLTVLVTGTPEEAAGAARLADLVGLPRIVPAAGAFTLGQSLAVWSRARLCVAGDTGPLHASAALGVPVLALFGPTLPEVSGPVGDGHRVVQASRPAAQQAYRTPGAERHMLAITEEMVLDALEAMLT